MQRALPSGISGADGYQQPPIAARVHCIQPSSSAVQHTQASRLPGSRGRAGTQLAAALQYSGTSATAVQHPQPSGLPAPGRRGPLRTLLQRAQSSAHPQAQNVRARSRIASSGAQAGLSRSGTAGSAQKTRRPHGLFRSTHGTLFRSSFPVLKALEIRLEYGNFWAG